MEFQQQNFIQKKKKFNKSNDSTAMRFQNIENNKIYKLYRQDELQRLKRKIQEIKTRKNQHLGSSRQKHVLPYISGGFGFSKQRKRQIEKQNQRLEKRLQKVKTTRSAFFLGNLKTINSDPDKKSKSKKKRNQNCTTSRSTDTMLLPVMRSERAGEKQVQNALKVDNQQSMTARPNNFRKEIIKIYTETLEDKNKKVL